MPSGPKRIDIVAQAPRCLACGVVMNVHFIVSEEQDSLGPGAVVVCHTCCAVSVYGETMKLEPFDRHRDAMAAQNPELLRRLDTAVAWLKQRKRSRGEIP